MKYFALCFVSSLFLAGCANQPYRLEQAEFSRVKKVAIVAIGHDVLFQSDSRNPLWAAQHESTDISSWKVNDYFVEKTADLVRATGRTVLPINFDAAKFQQIYARDRFVTLSVDSRIWPKEMREELKRLGREYDLDAVVFVYARQMTSDRKINPMGINMWTAGPISADTRLYMISRVTVFDVRNELWELARPLTVSAEDYLPEFPQASVGQELGRLPFKQWSSASQEQLRRTVIEFANISLPIAINSLFTVAEKQPAVRR